MISKKLPEKLQSKFEVIGHRFYITAWEGEINIGGQEVVVDAVPENLEAKIETDNSAQVIEMTPKESYKSHIKQKPESKPKSESIKEARDLMKEYLGDEISEKEEKQIPVQKKTTPSKTAQIMQDMLKLKGKDEKFDESFEIPDKTGDEKVDQRNSAKFMLKQLRSDGGGGIL